jgi:hypothetical protein
MSLLDLMRAERKANQARNWAELEKLERRIAGANSVGRDEPTAVPEENECVASGQSNEGLPQNVCYGGQIATTGDDRRLSPPVRNCAYPATTAHDARLSHTGYHCSHSAATTNAPGLSQNLQSGDGRRLARLLERYRRGHGMRPHEESAAEIAIEYGVSLRTAQRHVKRGTVPAKERRLGGDGKFHPGGSGRLVRSKVERELMLASQALARAARAASANGIQVHERELLVQIEGMAADLLTQ